MLRKKAGGNTVRVYDRSQESDGPEDDYSLERLFKDANLGVLQAMARAADARETTARGHSTAVTGYVRKLGAALGFSQEDVEFLEIAALLHDVGKIGIPESILSKPGALTEKEWEIVRTHPVIGELMIKRVPSLSKILTTVLHHHERWDGLGYPDGLKGEEDPRLCPDASLDRCLRSHDGQSPLQKSFHQGTGLGGDQERRRRPVRSPIGAGLP